MSKKTDVVSAARDEATSGNDNRSPGFSLVVHAKNAARRRSDGVERQVPDKFGGGRMTLRSPQCKEVQVVAQEADLAIRRSKVWTRQSKVRDGDDFFGDFSTEYARRQALACVESWEGAAEPLEWADGSLVYVSQLKGAALRAALENEHGPLPEIPLGPESAPPSFHSDFFIWLMTAVGEIDDTAPKELAATGEG